jgi:pteridine reductase
LVTGAARRIGACIAETLHGRGCTVFLHYHGSESDAQALAERLNQRRPGSARILQADLLDPDAPQKLASAVAQQTERLDLLVNNASMFYPTTVGETTGEDWKKLMGSNLKGPFFLTQALLPQLRAAAGSVVNILDVYADRPMAGHAVYSTAKAGQAMMTRALAKELGPDVRVNGVSPGAILWPQNEPDEETRQRIISRIVMRRPGTPADIAGAVAFLGLDAPYVTGQVLAVDGGRSLNI